MFRCGAILSHFELAVFEEGEFKRKDVTCGLEVFRRWKCWFPIRSVFLMNDWQAPANKLIRETFLQRSQRGRMNVKALPAGKGGR